MESVNVRNLEQIQETDRDGRSARVATILLAGVGGAALVIAAVLTFQKSAAPAKSTVDPLEALVAKAKAHETTPPEVVKREQVTFPSLLSDSERPTTALAAVKDERGRLVPAAPEAAALSAAALSADK